MENYERLMREYKYGYKHSIDLLSDPYVISLQNEILHYKKIVNRLSRKIQNKNKKYKRLEAQKTPTTMFGREVIIVPDSIANKVMLLNKDVIDLEGILK